MPDIRHCARASDEREPRSRLRQPRAGAGDHAGRHAVAGAADASTATGSSRLVLDAARSAYRLAKVEVPELQRVGDVDDPDRARAWRERGGARGRHRRRERADGRRAVATSRCWRSAPGSRATPTTWRRRCLAGCASSCATATRFVHIAAPIADGLKVVLFIPDFEMPTDESRKLLPATLSKDDAVHNIGRAALLVAALAQRRVGRAGCGDAGPDPPAGARRRSSRRCRTSSQRRRTAGALCAYLSAAAGRRSRRSRTRARGRIAAAMLEAAQVGGYPGKTMVTAPSDAGAAGRGDSLRRQRARLQAGLRRQTRGFLPVDVSVGSGAEQAVRPRAAVHSLRHGRCLTLCSRRNVARTCTGLRIAAWRRRVFGLRTALVLRS